MRCGLPGRPSRLHRKLLRPSTQRCLAQPSSMVTTPVVSPRLPTRSTGSRSNGSANPRREHLSKSPVQLRKACMASTKTREDQWYHSELGCRRVCQPARAGLVHGAFASLECIALRKSGGRSRSQLQEFHLPVQRGSASTPLVRYRGTSNVCLHNRAIVLRRRSRTSGRSSGTEWQGSKKAQYFSGDLDPARKRPMF